MMGFGLIAIQGAQLKLVEMGVLKMSSKKDNYDRLSMIHHKVASLIDQYKPSDFAIEAPFFGKNVQSMLKLGRAQGVAIASAINAGLNVTEYSPKKVKQSITGNGNADKEQVWKMLQHILHLPEESLQHYDASDALAVAVCHHFQGGPLGNSSPKKSKGWEDFLQKNPERIKKTK